MITRRQFGQAALAGGALAAGGALSLGTGTRTAGAATLGDDGLYNQDWFVESFLELEDDLAEAHDAGKHLVVMFEQAGCPFCRKTHEVNLERDDYLPYLKENFAILQLDLFGAREVTDFDGTTLEERALGRKWLVNFTPTILFFPNDPQAVAGKSGREAEIARIQGYLPPFYFYHFFEWVRSGAYRDEGFQRYSNDRLEEMRAKGQTRETWRLG
ncbi:thioredoxin family protein [Stappia sp. ES.058]|uniref:thioredoxin family protein n=1 Tax=Stappia sp. ES.058 TaxID=1881061 RepID=UPI00087AA98C|nr:thioredoxin family protein [Stappia sp. ES.058]SDT90496.1 Thioredoxin-related protein [Stappia sp. ES.058]